MLIDGLATMKWYRLTPTGWELAEHLEDENRLESPPSHRTGIPSSKATEGFFTASDLATRHGLGNDQLPAFRRRLERWRAKHALGGDGTESDGRARNEEKYLYRECAGLHIIGND